MAGAAIEVRLHRVSGLELSRLVEASAPVRLIVLASRAVGLDRCMYRVVYFVVSRLVAIDISGVGCVCGSFDAGEIVLVTRAVGFDRRMYRVAIFVVLRVAAAESLSGVCVGFFFSMSRMLVMGSRLSSNLHWGLV